MLRHLSAAALLLSACVPDIPEGVLACAPNATDDGCPPGWTCRVDARCYRFDDQVIYPSTGDDGGKRDATAADADAADGHATDAETDAAIDTDGDASDDAQTMPDVGQPDTCANGRVTCDDRMFCNGIERCDPGASAADARGCVAGTVVTCPSGQNCSELRGMCSACSDTGNDADGDMHQSNSCGGDDCDDGDPVRHPTAAEVCDGKDNNCDGTIDGPPADAACSQAAPTGATSSCVGGRCDPKCSDPDFDLVDGACVRHDDCANNPCAPGTCTDGSRSYSCACPTGFSGTTSCTDIDECENGRDNCDTAPDACVNTSGGFKCECPDGFVGTGVGPAGCRPDAGMDTNDKDTDNNCPKPNLCPIK